MKREILFGKPIIGDEEKKAVMEVLNSPLLVHGPRAKEFEDKFAVFTGAKHAITLSSCTAAMHLAYFNLGLKAGDEVIVPAQTHTATAHAVEFCGARPVFVDSEEKTGNIDIEQIESHISGRTKAISVVHFLGMPVNMEKVCCIAKKHNLFVLEDCALAIGSYYKGIHAGLHGDVGCFSFYPVKHITTAEGGMLITGSNKIAAKIERLKAFGVDRSISERKMPGVYDVNFLGYNYRMNEMQAALGSEQLKRVKGFLIKRKENYEILRHSLEGVEEIKVIETAGAGDYQSSYYCLSALLGNAFKNKRSEIVNYLKQNGIGTSVYYPEAVPLLSYYKTKYGFSEKEFPIAARISANSIAFPVGPHLDREDMEYISKHLKKALLEVR